MSIYMFPKVTGVIEHLTAHVALVYLVTVLPHVFVIQPKLIYSKTAECTLKQSLLVSVLVVDVDRQGFLVETYLVTVLTAYPSFYLTFVDRVFPFSLGLVGTSWLFIGADLPLLPVLIPACLPLA